MYIHQQHKDYLDGKLTSITYKALMTLAKRKFNWLKTKGIWGAKSLDNKKILAMTAALNALKGQLKLEDLQAPVGYTLQFSGQGGPAGHAKGSAHIRLEAQSARETVLHYTAQASVGGKIAQLGSRLIDMAAQKMANDFFTRFNEALQQRYGVVAEPEPSAAAGTPQAATGGLWSRWVAWLRRLFGSR
jgi:hypothetical protein